MSWTEGGATGLGAWTPGNPVERAPAEGDGPLVCFSGWAGDQPRAGEGVFASSFETWGPIGRGLWADVLEGLAGTGRVVRLRPHARHLLSDPQGCLNLLRERGTQGSRGPFEVILEPAALLTADMLETAADHVDRALEALLGRSDVPAVVLSDAELVESEAGPELRLVPPGAEGGVLGEALLRKLAGAAVEAGKPVFGLEV